MKCDMIDLGTFQCEGEIEEYSVEDSESHINWGNFCYCRAHAEEERQRGFTLTPIREDKTIDELWEMIEFLNCKLEKRLSNDFQKSTNVRQTMIRMIKAGNTIQAIKFMRDATGCTLKLAADTMRSLRKEIWFGLHGVYNPDLVGYMPNDFSCDL